MTNGNKILKAKCRICGKGIVSMYKSQLDWNLKTHETWCYIRQKEEQDSPDEEKKVAGAGEGLEPSPALSADKPEKVRGKK